MKTLPAQFKDNGSLYQFVARKGDVALYLYGPFETIKDEETGEVIATNLLRVQGYEVVRVRKYTDRVIMGNPSPATEAFPPASAWGDEGWTFSVFDPKNPNAALSKAMVKFEAEFIRAPYTDTIGEPTGKPRGRARNEFELDLDFTIDKPECRFMFVDVAEKYPDVDEPMLRNRLKAMVDGGTVLVVGTVPGGRGKPKNIYQLA